MATLSPGLNKTPTRLIGGKFEEFTPKYFFHRFFLELPGFQTKKQDSFLKSLKAFTPQEQDFTYVGGTHIRYSDLVNPRGALIP